MDTLLQTWIKGLSDLWSADPKWLQNWQAAFPMEAPNPAGRAAETWASGLKTAQAILTSMGRPGAAEAVMQAAQAAPEMTAKLCQIGLNTYAGFQNQIQARLQRLGRTIEPYKFDDLDKEALHLWSEIYQKEIRQFFNIPQLGLTREYQEKTLAAVDRCNLFQTALSELMQMLYLPMERSLKVLQQEMQEAAAKGRLQEDPKYYYKQWINHLEGHYMTLFKSPEYTAAMSKTIAALSEFWIARRAVLQGVLKLLDIPCYAEMDELYRELHELKKEVKALKKQFKVQPAGR